MKQQTETAKFTDKSFGTIRETWQKFTAKPSIAGEHVRTLFHQDEQSQ